MIKKASNRIEKVAKIIVKVEKTATGYSAHTEKYAAFTTGDTMTQLATNMVESLKLYFEVEGKGRIITPSDISFEGEL